MGDIIVQIRDVAVIVLKELLVCEIHVLWFLILQLPVYAEMKPQVARSDQCCVNDFSPAKNVAVHHIFLGGSNRIFYMAILAFVLGSRLLSYLVLYGRFSFKLNCSKDKQVTKNVNKTQEHEREPAD